MLFARKVWKFLVALKDGLALLFLLLFFALLYAILAMRPGAATVASGALLLDLDGVVVEEPSEPDPFSALLSTQAPVGETAARDVVRALDLAADDDRIKVVVVDMSRFLGGGMVHMQDIGAAMDRVRAAKKPVLAYANAMADDGVLLAAHASETWLDPQGGAFVTGPGGNSLYYARLLDRLKVDVKVFRVGTFKSAVEPYIRNDMSEPARMAYETIYGDLWDTWKADYRAARPRVDIEAITTDPVGWVRTSGGNAAQAGKRAGLVDKLGQKREFDQRVAELAGESGGDGPAYIHTDLADYLAANPAPEPGKAIGVITVAGEILDGDAGPGTAGGTRIADILDEHYDDDFAALVVRVDSPGGSVMASETIRAAIARYKQKGIPVVVSMANLAASGGYWVSTTGDRIFAEPGTVTGSIGVFATLPTFDRALSDLGVTGSGVRTTPLSGQPDVLTGLTPEVAELLQASVDNDYKEFVDRVAKARKLDPATAPSWAEGRPWPGGAARQLGLVDQFGGLDAALAYAAKAAGLKEGGWHAEYLGSTPDTFSRFVMGMAQGKAKAPMVRDLAGMAAQRQARTIASALARIDRMLAGEGAQALCLECPALPMTQVSTPEPGLRTRALLRLLGLTAG